jgi:hypothetical protein
MALVSRISAHGPDGGFPLAHSHVTLSTHWPEGGLFLLDTHVSKHHLTFGDV